MSYPHSYPVITDEELERDRLELEHEIAVARAKVGDWDIDQMPHELLKSLRFLCKIVEVDIKASRFKA